MEADELKEWMTTYGWSVRSLAKRLGVPFRTVQRWRDGTSRVPPYLELALQALTSTTQTDEHLPEPIEEVERAPFED